MKTIKLNGSEREESRKIIDQVDAAIGKIANGDESSQWALNRNIYKELVYIEMGTPGLRKALGLQVKHIDFKNQIISIEQQVIYSYKKGEPSLKDKLKTAGSRRKVHCGQSGETS